MTAPLTLSNARYLVPDWFLEGNVKTAADLSAAPDQIVICTCANCKEAQADDDDDSRSDLADEECSEKVRRNDGKDGAKEPNDSWSSSLARGLCPDEITYKTFAELRDMTAAAFVTDHDGKLIRPDASAVVFRMQKEESSTCSDYDCTSTHASFMEPVWMGRAVERVAKALGVSLVSLDLEDLEELGGEFHRQDKDAQKCKTPGDVAPPLASTPERPEEDAKAEQDASMANATSTKGSENKNEEAEEAEEVDGDNENASSDQQQWEPDVCSLSAFLSHFFGARAERYEAAESWQRTQLVWTVILDAVRNQLGIESTASDMTGGISRPSAVIYHITDYRDVDEYKLKRRVLTRFAGMVQQRRKQGDAVVMIVSTKDSSLKPNERLQRKIGARPASTMIARNVKMSDTDLAIRAQVYKGALNVRTLRHCLREYCAHLLPADLLKVNADWACAERGKSFRTFGGTMWTSEDMSHMVTQIMGRAWLKPKLRFTDIRAVLNRLGFYDTLESETQDTPARSEEAEFQENDESNTNTSEDTPAEDTPEESTPEETTPEDNPAEDTAPEDTAPEEEVNEVLRHLDLNDWEQELTKCIVWPGTLKTHWDDVIIDQEAKTLMQQFVASHRLQFDCASEFLRQALRIRGALLYGPPGTGKTELCRAVATASDSRMLAVTHTSLTSKFTDQSEKYIEAAFTLAGKLHPCVLFIDEVDSLFYRRSSNDESWMRSRTNQFLLQMDGLQQNDKAPLVLVATNRPWDLDDAFLRRLQHKVYLGLPDIEARAEILGLFLHQDDLDPTLNIHGLAQVTGKYSASDLRNLCAKAGLLWEAEQARLHSLYESVSDKFAIASNAPKKVQLGIDHFVKALDEIRPSNSDGVPEELDEFLRKHNPKASTAGKDPGIRFIYNSSTKQRERVGVRALISRPTVSDDVPAVKHDDPEDEMQLQTWCQLDLQAHLVHCLHTSLVLLLFCSQRVLEKQMQVQTWCQIDLRTHLMHRLHTNLSALIFWLHTYDHSKSLVTLQQPVLNSEDSTAAGSKPKIRQKTQKSARRKESKLKEAPKIRQKTQNSARRKESKLGESASAAETVKFRYTALGTDEFRLLEVAPGDTDAPLACTLKHTSFQSNEKYCALSYTWGSPEPPFFIQCNGGEIRITRSLHEALCQMRRTWCPVTIWADAICINQSDNSEKSQQVMRMVEIYSKASRLFIWLGNPVTASDADSAVDTMEQVGSFVASIMFKFPGSVWSRVMSDVASHKRWREEIIGENNWEKIQDFFSMPWFSRVWVFQEVATVMAFRTENIRLGYGNRVVGWTSVVDMMNIIEPFQSVDPLSVRCPTAITMTHGLWKESLIHKVNIHLPNDQITEDDVVKALARKDPPDGRPPEAPGLYSTAGTITYVAIVIDLGSLTFPNANEYNDPDVDAALMVEAVTTIFSDEFRAVGENALKDIGGVNLDGLAASALGWFFQCETDDEWWLPGNPTLLKMRRFVGSVTAASLRHRNGFTAINVGLKTANFSYMPGLINRLWSRLQLARRLEATDPRDRLYAFLPMFSEDVADEPLLKVDYNLSVADVYINSTMYFVQRLMCLDVLEFVNDMPTKKPRPANLPSWAIDLSSATDLDLFETGMYFNAGGAFDLGLTRFAMHALHVRVSNDRRRLDLNAYLVGEVTELALLPHHYKQTDHLTDDADRDVHENVETAASKTYCLALNMINRLGQSTRNWKAVNAENPAVGHFTTSATSNMQLHLYITGERMLEVFWRCLMCDRWTYHIRDGEEAPNSPYERAAQMEQAYRKYHKMVAKAPIPEGLEPRGRNGDATSERLGSPDSTPTKPGPDVFLFSAEFEPVARTRVFGVVADGLIGWFPRRAEKGDMLVILPGARCPYVLRKVRRDASMDRNKDINEGNSAQEQDRQTEWEVIGHAYVQGLMDDIVTEWKLDLTENGKGLLGKLNANGEAPALERICLV